MKAILAYDGSEFLGYQSQPKGRTVQQVVDRALVKMHKGDERIHSVASGRTDAGVHALGQVIHFDTPFTIPNDRWVVALNTLLPKDVRVLHVEQVPADFHARYDATGKTYLYKWSLARVHSPFERHQSVHLDRLLPDIEKMQQATDCFVGTHDFTSFCSSKTATDNRVRTVRHLSVERVGEEIHMTIEGDGFLYNQVRTIAGMLLAIGRGWNKREEIPEIFAAKDRKKAGKTAPAHGVYLMNVTYEKG